MSDMSTEKKKQRPKQYHTSTTKEEKVAVPTVTSHHETSTARWHLLRISYRHTPGSHCREDEICRRKWLGAGAGGQESHQAKGEGRQGAEGDGRWVAWAWRAGKMSGKEGQLSPALCISGPALPQHLCQGPCWKSELRSWTSSPSSQDVGGTHCFMQTRHGSEDLSLHLLVSVTQNAVVSWPMMNMSTDFIISLNAETLERSGEAAVNSRCHSQSACLGFA